MLHQSHNVPFFLTLSCHAPLHGEPTLTAQVGGLAEVLVETVPGLLRTPSVQLYISLGGRVQVVSTHEQEMDSSGLVFVGCRYPAGNEYRCVCVDCSAHLCALVDLVFSFPRCYVAWRRRSPVAGPSCRRRAWPWAGP